MSEDVMISDVEKRDGSIVEFDRKKIERVVERAFRDVPKSYGEEELSQIAKDIVDGVVERLKDLNEDVINVEIIQDTVEEGLMLDNYVKVAKEYIIYREQRRRSRSKRSKGKGLLSEEFLSKYKHKPNPFPTELGEFIYYRTYSRWLPEENRREYWWETVKRSVEYNTSLAPTTKKEAEELYDNIYNFRNFLAGRTLWTGGTKASKKYPMSNYNCAFTVIDNFKSYEDLFYLLMIGAGVGVRVLKEDVERLAPVRTNLEVKHEYYVASLPEEREELTSYRFDGEDTIIIEVGDSKEAWVQALKIYLEVLYRHEFKVVDTIYFNYNSVRPKGERLKTFGGHASGHESVKRMFDKIDKLLKRKEDDKVKLKPIDSLDIANIIGENVVSGGVRRTSEIGLFDADDEEVKTAKSDLYTQENGEWVINKEIEHRQLSNNSIFYQEKPSREQLSWHVKQMRFSGEPGFVNAEEGRRRRDNFQGVNPCAEILLDSNGMCNLVSLNVMAFVDEDGNLDKEGLLNAQRLNVHSAYRMALVNFELSDWDYVNKRDRLVGLSLTGWQDAMNKLGWNDTSVNYTEGDWSIEEISRGMRDTEGYQKQKELLSELREIAEEESEKYSNRLYDEEPVLVTTVKPEGTQTQMPTVSSGLHYNHSPYYIRRVRINANDPLVNVAEDLGWNVKNDVGQDEEEEITRKVLEFPVKAPDGLVKDDVSAIEQLETYKLFMESYVDHNASITVHVRDDEWDDVEEWLWQNWNSVVGISFLSYSDNFYDLMPYEETDEETYREMVENMDEFKPHLVNKYEQNANERELEQDGCESGVCPVR
jgi:ribonucleoside-diphosphate reductase alpha chain/ribonucleoside-triphosphate reductase